MLAAQCGCRSLGDTSLTRVPPGEPAGRGVAPAASRADGGALQGRGADVDAAAAGQDQLQDLRVQKTLHRLAVDVRDEVAGPQSRLESRAVVLHRHDKMLDGVDVRVSVVDPDGPDGKSETPWTPLDDDGGLELCHQWTQFPARRRVTRARA